MKAACLLTQLCLRVRDRLRESLRPVALPNETQLLDKGGALVRGHLVGTELT